MLLTADTNDSALLASVGGAAGVRCEGAGGVGAAGGTFEAVAALGEVLPTMPLMAAASLGFDDGFS